MDLKTQKWEQLVWNSNKLYVAQIPANKYFSISFILDKSIFSSGQFCQTTSHLFSFCQDQTRSNLSYKLWHCGPKFCQRYRYRRLGFFSAFCWLDLYSKIFILIQQTLKNVNYNCFSVYVLSSTFKRQRSFWSNIKIEWSESG